MGLYIKLSRFENYVAIYSESSMTDTGSAEPELLGAMEGPNVGPGRQQKYSLIDLNRQKRASKRETSKIKYQIEKLIAGDASDVQELEHRADTLWEGLEATQTIMDELSEYFMEQKDLESRRLIMQESKELETECQRIIEKVHSIIVNSAGQSSTENVVSQQVNTAGESSAETANSAENSQGSEPQGDQTIEDTQVAGGSNPVPGISSSTLNQEGDSSDQDNPSIPTQSSNAHNESLTTETQDTHESSATGSANRLVTNHRLKPLKVPTFEGDKKRFEEFWGLFESLVDASEEPISLKMARLRQSLTGAALDAIRGLGVSEPEYVEAKEILKSKFGGQRRQLRAYLDDLERMGPLRANDVSGFERFADLVRVTVVKLQAENKDGELGDGTLYSLLAKKLTGPHLETYTRWMNEHAKERSVLTLRDWLREEVAIRIEAAGSWNRGRIV